jgi:acetyltransferase-like isoleucine patch superfamily enzyme
LQIISFNITWIGGFGLWKEHLEKIDDFAKDSSLHLSQVSVLLDLLIKNKKAIIFDSRLVSVMPVGGKNYSISKVFGKNFIEILKRKQYNLSSELISLIKEKVLKELILPYYYDPQHFFGLYSLEDGLEDFRSENYYNDALRDARTIASTYKYSIKAEDVAKLWREKNSHNQTILKRICDTRKVNVGKSTYGVIDVIDWGASNERLDIGNYVSIGQGVTFILGGGHEYSGLTTFPLKVKFLNHVEEAISKGPIKICDDVWIGNDVTILSGVKVGQGAIVGACSVVASDVEAYSIVVGNPARVIKYRFDDDLRKELLKIDFSKLTPLQLIELSNAFNDYSNKKIDIAEVINLYLFISAE